MDLIEQLFGIAPDGGSGSSELLLLLIALALRRPLERLSLPLGLPD